MGKCIFLLLAFSSAILAVERPEWYPENAAEIEAKCKEQYAITDENLAELVKMNKTDTPALRSFAFCVATGKNVYRPGVGFEPERFSEAVKYAHKLDCKQNAIRDCAEKHQDLKPEELMYLSTVKCIFFDNDKEDCKQIE